MRFAARGQLAAVVTAALLLSPVLRAAEADAAGTRADEPVMLDKKDYRHQIEEVVVTASPPEWRKPQQEEWRPQRFELPAESQPARLETFPAYTRDERDQYDQVRDRMGEKAEIKLFEWKF